jgi:hypothetical protein
LQELAEAIAILVDMIYKDVAPNAHVYNSIRDAYIESYDAEQAFRLVEKMKNSGVLQL